MDQTKTGKVKGDWNLTNVVDTSKSHTPGAVYQTWTNNVTGSTSSLWSNANGNGPQIKTIQNNAKPK